MPVFAHAAFTPWQSNPQGQVRLLSDYNTVPSSGTLQLGLHFKPTPGWTLYWKNAGDAGIPPKVSWDGSTGIKNAEFLWPAPTHLILPGSITEYGYEGETVYPLQATLTGKPVHLKAEVSYLTCKESCIPYKYLFTLDLPSGPAPVIDADSSALIQGALAKVSPANLSDADIQNQAPVVRFDPQAPVSTSVPVSSGSTLSILLLAFIGGLILNIMPCVLPVLSIKLLGLLQHSGQARILIIRNSLASAAGILVSFLALALAAILARHAGLAVGWGIQFQQPVFVGILALIIFLFALNLLGVFEINMPRFVGHFAATYGWGESFGSYFMSGLFATILATPCSAPFLGTALGFALVQPAGTVLLIFSAVGIGMALPYFLLAMFPSSLHWLPKPGAWMGKIRILLGLLLIATALWLGSVLMTQLGHPSSWHSSSGNSTVAERWIPFDAGDIERRLTSGETVFVDVTADWCFTCKYNERFVLKDPEVARAFEAKGIVLMRADWTRHDSEIGDYLKKFGRAGIPFYALYRPGKQPVLLSEFLTKKQVLEALRS